MILPDNLPLVFKSVFSSSENGTKGTLVLYGEHAQLGQKPSSQSLTSQDPFLSWKPQGVGPQLPARLALTPHRNPHGFLSAGAGDAQGSGTSRARSAGS